MKNGSISAESLGDKTFEQHPTNGDLYDFFVTQRDNLDADQRQIIAIHVALCTQCANIGEFIEETEEHLATLMISPQSDEDRASLERSLATAKEITVHDDQLGVPVNQQRTWAPIFLKDFFYVRWRTFSGRLQLVAGSILAATALALVGYVGWDLALPKASNVQVPTELPQGGLNPTASPAVAAASPTRAITSPPGLQSKELQGRTIKPQRSSNEIYALLAHRNSDINLGRLRESQDRGGGSRVRFHPTIRALSGQLTRIHITLPEGSVSGSYIVSIEDAYFKPVAPSAKGESLKGKELTVWLDLRGLPEKSYYLGIAFEGRAPLHYQIRLLAPKRRTPRPQPSSPP